MSRTDSGTGFVIRVTSKIRLDENEVAFDFVRSTGPGGQNVNKVATAVQLRFDVGASPSLPEEVRARLRNVARNRINADGILVIEARRYRSQARNREDAMCRLVDLIRKATEKPTPRRKTRPSAASRERRLEEKRRRSRVKRKRRPPPRTQDDDAL
jgi:ribosome-associated protein